MLPRLIPAFGVRAGEPTDIFVLDNPIGTGLHSIAVKDTIIVIRSLRQRAMINCQIGQIGELAEEEKKG